MTWTWSEDSYVGIMLGIEGEVIHALVRKLLLKTALVVSGNREQLQTRRNRMHVL